MSLRGGASILLVLLVAGAIIAAAVAFMTLGAARRSLIFWRCWPCWHGRAFHTVRLRRVSFCFADRLAEDL
jgi:hypothetical protein